MTPSSSTAISNRKKPSLRTWLQTLMAMRSRPMELRQTVVTITSYTAITILAFVTVTTLYCFFLALSVFDDVIRVSAPGHLWQKTKDRGVAMVDWVSILDQVRVQLSQLADWQDRKRESWPFDQIDSDRLHDLVTAVTDYLSDYVHANRHDNDHRAQK
ncbi:hypothetical protein BJV82DRAFT_582624 [Fennellomyces sp. T-0311]|nr:hypothetical protein BJV82DRAFT_582624 [Fennellomyces sp. T-0311]